MEKFWKAHAAKSKADYVKEALPPLKEGEVAVDIHYSTVNYKDALALLGKPGVIRHFPLTCGIDLAGIVRESRHKDYAKGDAVFANGQGLGEAVNGGLASAQNVSGDYLLKAPSALSLKNIMQTGTGGYTAALCLMDLLNIGITPKNGPLYVSGASGGVGMFSVALAAVHGFDVVAISRKKDADAFLKKLGAKDVVLAEDFEGGEQKRPLDKTSIGSAIDTTGGEILSTLLTRINDEGAIAACGLAQNVKLDTTVLPFILRGVKLLGINSVYQPKEKRQKAWQMLAKLNFDEMEDFLTEAPLEDAQNIAAQILAGQHKGRFVINCQA